MRKLLAPVLLFVSLLTAGPAFAAKAAAPAAAAAPSFQQATKDYQAGKYQVALIEFEKYKAKYPTNILVHYYEALCYQGLAQFDMAKTEFQYVIDNGPDPIKGQATAGLRQLSEAHSTPGTGIGNQGPPVPTFARPAEPGRVLTVLEFLDSDLCGKCRAFAPQFFQASCQFQDLIFGRVIIDQGDQRVQMYNPTKRHPYVVMLDGTLPVQKVLFKGVMPNDWQKIVRQIKEYKKGDNTPYSPIDNKQVQNQNNQNNFNNPPGYNPNSPANTPTNGGSPSNPAQYNPNAKEPIIPTGPQ